jgi:LacI family transcriptional regulator
MINKLADKTAVTIRDVARMAEVSEATVSRVMNGRDGVSEPLAERVNRAIEVLHYKPNSVARALKNKSSKTLGLIIPSVENPIFAQLVSHVEKAAQRYGFSIILCSSEGNIKNEERYIEFLIEKQVDGILFDATGAYSGVFEELKSYGMPTVVIGKKLSRLATANVSVSNYKGGRMACEYLIKTGCRRIAFLSAPHDSMTALEDRFEGYRDALKAYGLPFEESFVFQSGTSYQSATQKTLDMISADIGFDAVFASNDVLAIGCMNTLIDYGIRVPDEVSIIGYDDIPFSMMTRPRLSSVSNNIDMLASLSVKELLRIIYTHKDDLKAQCLEPALMLRETTRVNG